MSLQSFLNMNCSDVKTRFINQQLSDVNDTLTALAKASSNCEEYFSAQEDSIETAADSEISNINSWSMQELQNIQNENTSNNNIYKEMSNTAQEKKAEFVKKKAALEAGNSSVTKSEVDKLEQEYIDAENKANKQKLENEQKQQENQLKQQRITMEQQAKINSVNAEKNSKLRQIANQKKSAERFYNMKEASLNVIKNNLENQAKMEKANADSAKSATESDIKGPKY